MDKFLQITSPSKPPPIEYIRPITTHIEFLPIKELPKEIFSENLKIPLDIPLNKM